MVGNEGVVGISLFIELEKRSKELIEERNRLNNEREIINNWYEIQCEILDEAKKAFEIEKLSIHNRERNIIEIL